MHSGLACGAARDMPSAFAAMRQGGRTRDRPRGPRGDRRIVPTIVFHGDRDTTVNPRNGDQVIAQSARGAAICGQVQHGQVPGGHAYTRMVQADASGADDAGAMGHPWGRPCLVGRQPSRLLHRSARTRCDAAR